MIDVPAALEAIAEKATRGDIFFLTHDAIALRAQRLLDDPDCTIERLEKLISADPLLSARTIGIANSIAYNPGGRPINDIKSAVTRIGFATLRAITASAIVQQMAEDLPTDEQKAMTAALWDHTIHVASLARIIAKRVTRQNPDAAFLAGIVHEIGGFYLISQAKDYPGLFAGNFEAWQNSGRESVGRAVLSALEMPTYIRDAIETFWSGFLAMPPSSIGDTLLLADEISPKESPLASLTGISREVAAAEIDMLVEDDTLSHILDESSGEMASLAAALKT